MDSKVNGALVRFYFEISTLYYILVQFIAVYFRPTLLINHMETLLTPEQVASQLSVEITTVYTWLRNSRLSGVKLGRLWRVRSTDVEQFMQKGWKGGISSEMQQQRITNPNADTAWIDALPQIDLSSVYAPNIVFSREEIYRDDEAEQHLYGTKVQASKGQK